MKRIVSILLVLSILFLFSCSLKEQNNDLSENKGQDGGIKVQDSIIVYYDGEASRGDIEVYASDLLKETSLSIKSVDELNFDYIHGEKVEDSNTRANDLIIKIDEKEYKLPYKSTYRTAYSVSNVEKTNNLSAYDVYETDEISIRYRTQTKDLTYLQVLSAFQRTPGENISKEQIPDAMLDLLYEYHGKEYMDNYTLVSYEPVPNRGTYLGLFRRYIHGYASEDFIKIEINPDGSIVGFSFHNKGIYDNVKNEVTKESIDKAYNYIFDMFKEKNPDINQNDACVFVNCDGSIYLRMQISIGDNLNRYYLNLDQFK